jgi:dolichyl-phosphate-mannose-protein mannosyltransferase
MPDSKSFAGSPRSRALALAAVILLLAAISAAAASWCFARGYTLYDGDAEAHLNIARRVLDSRTPGGEQFGTVWLPLPHLLMIPLVTRDDWWRSGLAGMVPSALAFVLAGTFLFAAARRAYASATAGFAAALIFALNPNMLYLQSTPMTEPLLAASLAALLWATLWFRDSQSVLAVLAAAAASSAASLTRYEGWFVIPFVSFYLLVVARKKWHAVLFAVLAAIAPLAWLAHNWFYFNNPLEFYNGPYSAMAIYQRQLAQGMTPYPGDHDWRTAVRYYFAAIRWTAGGPLLFIGAIGGLAALWRRAWWPLVLLALAPAFYLWSIHSSGTPIFVPDLWPFSWYNTRYALAALPLLAFAAGGLATIFPPRFALPVALALAAASVPWGRTVICWKEADVNSAARRDWTREAAGFLAQNYESGSGILFTFGDLSGVLREAGIPLREGLHQGNHPAWDGAVTRPDLGLYEQWALAFSGDTVATAILRAEKSGRHYEMKRQIIVKGAPVVEIYQRRPPPTQ